MFLEEGERPWAELVHITRDDLPGQARRAPSVDTARKAQPDTGKYIVQGALVPVDIDRSPDIGEYVGPNAWTLHTVSDIDGSLRISMPIPMQGEQASARE